jgi:hypothetical protein
MVEELGETAVTDERRMSRALSQARHWLSRRVRAEAIAPEPMQTWIGVAGPPVPWMAMVIGGWAQGDRIVQVVVAPDWINFTFRSPNPCIASRLGPRERLDAILDLARAYLVVEVPDITAGWNLETAGTLDVVREANPVDESIWFGIVTDGKTTMFSMRQYVGPSMGKVVRPFHPSMWFDNVAAPH